MLRDNKIRSAHGRSTPCRRSPFELLNGYRCSGPIRQIHVGRTRRTLRIRIIALVGAICLALLATRPANALDVTNALDVIVTVKPIHGIVAKVMEGVAQPRLLLDGGEDPHTYAIRISDSRALAHADVVFWVGRDLEIFLDRTFGALPDQVNVVALDQAPGLSRLPLRTRGIWISKPENKSTQSGALDPHIWLDPDNAVSIARFVAATLAEYDPPNAMRYAQNADSFARDVTRFMESIGDLLGPQLNSNYLVLNDAFQHFENRFGLTPAGAVLNHAEDSPGAKSLKLIRTYLQSESIRCVFGEVSPPPFVRTLLERTKAQYVWLDPMGRELDAGPAHYFVMMEAILYGLERCLAQSA